MGQRAVSATLALEGGGQWMLTSVNLEVWRADNTDHGRDVGHLRRCAIPDQSIDWVD